MHLFFQPDLSVPTLTLSEEESKHCIRVLRMKCNDEVHLADGKGTHAIGLVTDDHPKKTVIQIRSTTTLPKSHPYYLHIAVAPTKNFDRMEWFIEKAVECGIDEISFIETEHSERSKINMERCEKIAISAMKQSKQWHLPQLHTLRSLPDFLSSLHNTNETRCMAWCENDGTHALSQTLQQQDTNSALILIGPEGDFTAEEVALARGHNFLPVSLGTSILRTETAALYACMALKALKG